MSHHILTWAGAGLVTIDLDDGRRVVLVFTDPEAAGVAGAAVQRAADQPVEVAEVDVPADKLEDALDVLLGIAGSPADLALVFPGDPLFAAVLSQLLPA